MFFCSYSGFFQSHGRMKNCIKKYGLTEEEIAFIETLSVRWSKEKK